MAEKRATRTKGCGVVLPRAGRGGIREGNASPGSQQRMVAHVRDNSNNSLRSEKVRQANRKRWKDPEQRLQMIANIRDVWKDPVNRKRRVRRIGSGVRKAWANPEKRHAWVQGLRAANAKPEVRKRKRDSWTDTRRQQAAESSKRTWENSDVRKRRTEGIKRALATPEIRARHVAGQKRAWADPEVRARMTAGLKRACSDPAKRQKMSASMKAVWASPGYRNRTVRAQRIAAAKPERRKSLSDHSKKLWAERNSKLAEAERLIALQRPKSLGRPSEPEEEKIYFNIGQRIENQISAEQKRQKSAVVTARKLVAENLRMSYNTIVVYHRRYLKTLKLQSDV